MNNNSIMRGDLGATEVERFSQGLAHFNLIDVGVIKNINKYGRANVSSCARSNNTFITYENAEVIYPGSEKGVFMTLDIGSMCLVFIPQSCVPDLRNKQITVAQDAYCVNGAKVMPISNGSQALLTLAFDSEGNLGLSSSNYHFTFNPDYIATDIYRFIRSRLNSEGSLYISRTPENAMQHKIIVENAQEVFQHTTKDGNTTITQKIMDTGDISLTYSNTSDDSQISNIIIHADGSSSIMKGDSENPDINITIDTDNNISVKTTTSANISVEGKEIHLNGSAKTLVTYAALKSALDSYFAALNTAIGAGVTSAGGAYTPPATPFNPAAAEAKTVKTK